MSLVAGLSLAGAAQVSPPPPAPDPGAPEGSLLSWAGLRVDRIEFEGVGEDILNPIPSQLPQHVGEPLDPLKVRDSLRRLYATGLYQTIQVAGRRSGNDVSIVFSGAPRLFFGRVTIDGVKEERLASVLQSSTQVQAGAPYSPARVAEAGGNIASALEDNGYYQAQVTKSTRIDGANSLIDLDYKIAIGRPARVGEVKVSGESGLSEQQFRKRAKLKQGSKVTRNTVSRALSSLRKNYAKSNRLAAAVSLTSKEYVPSQNQVNYEFLAHEGPLVNVEVEGAKIHKRELQKLVPVFEEGAVDQDLLNEGAQNLRGFYQGKGYFDVLVKNQPVQQDPRHVTALYTVDLGPMHVVDSVTVTGNKYFSRDIIDQRIQVRSATVVNRHGVFSQQMLNQDVNRIKALYSANGFTRAVIKAETIDLGKSGRGTQAHLKVIYDIQEGAQQRIGKYDINGATAQQLAEITPTLNAQPGQPYSAANLDQDRDLVLTYFMSHGYDDAQINLFQETEADHDDLVDVSMKIVSGPQFFVRKVIVSGLHYTRPSVVDDRVVLKPGDPLNQTALLEMQRKLYDLALFNEANLAIQNPDGHETYKNVLLNLTEAKRWDLSYGFGLEAQTGTPTEGCLSIADQILLGIVNSYKCSPNGNLGISPRIIFNVSRTNLFGTDQSITLRTNYGTLEQVAMLAYQVPRVFRAPSFTLSLSGGYNNSAYISTYRAAVLSGSLRMSERVDKANNLIYSFSYRRVSVNPNTLQVSLEDIPLLAQPTRVGGPGITWIRDTRDAPLDAHRGSFTTVDEFLASSIFASEANFNRIDITNATYYGFGRDRQWVFARQTRYGQERAYGNGNEQLIPLPERLYAGGPTSHRGFAFNSAGPRDPQTGYPIGGAGAFVNNTELRMPPPLLPYLGTNLSFVLFHDMGNIFQNSSQVWPSMFRTKQPHSYTCRDLSVPYTTYNTPDTCDFNDFSHAVGLGLRYHTPIGPIRTDFSYNLNPPIYPVIYDYTTNSSTPNPHVGQAEHFNFFFSIGQSF